MVIETAPRKTAPLELMQPPDTLKCDLPSGQTDLMSQGCSQSRSRLHCEVRWCLALAGGQWLTRFTKSGSTFFPKARQMFLVDCRQPCDAKDGDFFRWPPGGWRCRAILGRLFSKMRRVLRLSMWECNCPNCDSCYYRRGTRNYIIFGD